MSNFGELDALIADMTAVPRELDGLVRTVVQKAAADIKADAQLMAPVDTGNLRSSITYETQVGADAVTGEIGPTANYGVYVELGTVKMAPQPYLGPAFDRHSDAFEGALGQILGGLL